MTSGLREISLDTETTGLDPRDGHRMIEIGCVEMIDKIKTGNIFHIYINPQREVPEDAFKIHGISTEFLQDKPLFKDVAQDFVDFVKDSKLVIHNAAFDMKFINFELRQCDMEIIERKWVIDSLQIARNKFPGAANSLDALCKRFAIDASKRVKHGALLDAELLADVYLELMGGSQYSMLADDVSGTKDDLKKEQKVRKTLIPSRNFTVSDEDLEKHKKFVQENFPESDWNY